MNAFYYFISSKLILSPIKLIECGICSMNNGISIYNPLQFFFGGFMSVFEKVIPLFFYGDSYSLLLRNLGSSIQVK